MVRRKRYIGPIPSGSDDGDGGILIDEPTPTPVEPLPPEPPKTPVPLIPTPPCGIRVNSDVKVITWKELYQIGEETERSREQIEVRVGLWMVYLGDWVRGGRDILYRNFTKRVWTSYDKCAPWDDSLWKLHEESSFEEHSEYHSTYSRRSSEWNYAAESAVTAINSILDFGNTGIGVSSTTGGFLMFGGYSVDLSNPIGVTVGKPLPTTIKGIETITGEDFKWSGETTFVEGAAESVPASTSDSDTVTTASDETSVGTEVKSGSGIITVATTSREQASKIIPVLKGAIDSTNLGSGSPNLNGVYTYLIVTNGHDQINVPPVGSGAGDLFAMLDALFSVVPPGTVIVLTFKPLDIMDPLPITVTPNPQSSDTGVFKEKGKEPIKTDWYRGPNGEWMKAQPATK